MQEPRGRSLSISGPRRFIIDLVYIHTFNPRLTYTLDALAGYPDFFCPGSKFGEVVMREGLRVSFTPAFTGRGPIADGIARIDIGD